MNENGPGGQIPATDPEVGFKTRTQRAVSELIQAASQSPLTQTQWERLQDIMGESNG